MITAKINLGTDNISKELKSIQRQLRQLPNDAHDKFVDLTPVRSGNARRRTRLQGTTIVADYPYAERLDNGYSNQAPKGMTLPWERWLANRIRQIFGR
jgi:hypothetical protein